MVKRWNRLSNVALPLILVLALALGVAACGRQDAAPGGSAEPGGSPTGDNGDSAPAGGTADGGAADGQPRRGGTLVVALPANPLTYNPNARPDDAGIMIFQNLFSKLVTLDDQYHVIPDLAREWDVSDDGLTYTFHLHPDARWHDGEPVTSADVKWTYEAILANQGLAAGSLAAIDAIETPDEHTVILRLQRPNAPLLNNLAWFGVYIMPKHLYDNGQDWLANPAAQEPVGSGPFRFESARVDEHVTLVANPDYFGGAPYLERLVFSIIPDPQTAAQALMNGEVDVSLTRPSLTQLTVLRNAPGVVVEIAPMPNRYYVPMNHGRELFQDLRVRRAVAHALNRQEVLDRALQGVGAVAEGFYTPAIGWAYNPDAVAPAFDPAAAEALLDEAGYPRGAGGARLTLTMTIFSGGEWADIAAVLVENLRAVGIEVDLVQLDEGAWIQRTVVDRDFDLTLLAGQQGPDPDQLRLRFGSMGALNMMGYANPDFDQLLAQAAALTDEEQRRPLYFEAQEMLAQDLPFVPVAEMVNLHLFRDTVRGMPHHHEQIGAVPQWGFHRAWLDR
ncbi:MAG TPA: ABC transporter substrate-binding protein [Bacillota bacterium]